MTTPRRAASAPANTTKPQPKAAPVLAPLPPRAPGTLRIATYNIENLFQRARVLGLDDRAESSRLLAAHRELNVLLAQASYTPARKTRILALLDTLGLLRANTSRIAVLRQNRGQLVRRKKSGAVEIVAAGRPDWVGWIDLATEGVDVIATQNTARVVHRLDADILAVIEAESRPALCRFASELLPSVSLAASRPLRPVERIMLIDGNDPRGIDVGLLLRGGVTIDHMRSHVDDTDPHGLIFSRDCPEYFLRPPSGEPLVLLINHFKSKSGDYRESTTRRHRQATRTAQIYRSLQHEGHTHIAVVGDLNDTPHSEALHPLLHGTDLRDVSTHDRFASDGRVGTFGNGTQADKIDYLLLSPALFGRVKAAGVDRAGVWGGTHGTLWPHLPEISRPGEAASDHGAVWVDVGV